MGQLLSGSTKTDLGCYFCEGQTVRKKVEELQSTYGGLRFTFIPLIGGTEKSALWVNPPYTLAPNDFIESCNDLFKLFVRGFANFFAKPLC